MDEIKGFIITLVSMLILITAIELISPDNSMKKYLKFVLGTILIAVMISPIFSFISKGEDGLSKKVEEYIQLVDNKSFEANEVYKENTNEIAFRENLEKNCNRLLKEKFENLEFESAIECEVNMGNISYSINGIKIKVKDKGVSKIEKIVISREEKSTEVSSSNEEVSNQEEIINYLSQTFNITKDKIMVYKMN
ncbi:stage III sporulation protein AF [Clostridium nigeriense]|uniref:stage III sporulation protein AF n=1 Tax=Clostridium nigeriense TaxID=1805470 RepID=UPI0008343D9E|nr:stage III sporulation protein AF [Clostridium nigeriense]